MVLELLPSASSGMLPFWLPNIHPLVVHFPIALLITAVAADLLALAFARPASTAVALYAAGAGSAVAAYVSGRQAAAVVLLPGMAQAVMLEHWNWALATTIYFSALSVVRLGVFSRGRSLPAWARLGVVAAGMAGLILLYHTGEQGGRLVFQHGVGVSGPGGR